MSKNYIELFKKILEPILYFLTVIGVIVNAFVLMVLCFSTKYNITLRFPFLPSITTASWFALALLVFIVCCGLTILLSNTKNLMINFFANCAIFALPSKIISTLIRPSDDDGVIIETKLYKVIVNYTPEEKYHWIPRLEKELEFAIHKLQLNDISYFNNYNELKLAAIEAKELFLNQLELANQATKIVYVQGQTWGDWLWNNKVLFVIIIFLLYMLIGLFKIYVEQHMDQQDNLAYLIEKITDMNKDFAKKIKVLEEENITNMAREIVKVANQEPILDLFKEIRNLTLFLSENIQNPDEFDQKKQILETGLVSLRELVNQASNLIHKQNDVSDNLRILWEKFK